MDPYTMRIPFGGRELIIETGRMARQADGSVLVRCGDTMVLVTAVGAKDPREGIDFFPLTVDYQEKLFAAGRIPGSYFRREGRPTEKETLTSRIVDRSIRPLFPEGYQCETQVIATVLSSDLENEADVLALTGASAALHIADVPFGGPIAGIRVGRIDGKFVANPTASQREQSDLDLMMAASKDAIVMVEGGAKEASEEDIVEALLFGQREVQPVLAAQEEMRRAIGREKRKVVPPAVDEALKARVREEAYDKIKAAYAISDKLQRYSAMSAAKKQVVEILAPAFTGREKEIKTYFSDLQYDYMRHMITHDQVRIAGRKTDEVRKITCEVGVLPRTHGSALFTRGETQALCVTTLGTSDDEQRIELLSGQSFKKFMLHYNFPPFSVGEAKFLRSPGRREIGHGALAERAIRQVLPTEDKFPYTIRIVSDILESNGSSSMATVCGGTLSLMDAGIPIAAPVAGIAMGLVKEGDRIAILSDILGDEDHLGDMDFKVCGTKKGITALQMDIKISGLSKDILSRALLQAKTGRLHILDRMLATLPESRTDISQYAPRITQIKIRPERIKDVIGPGGKVIKDIIARTGCSVDIEDDGTVSIASANAQQVQQAIQMVKNLTQEAEVGKVYLGTVRKIMDFGAFVEIFPGTDGLVHISELSDKRVKTVTEVLNEGDEVLVKVVGVDNTTGKIRLSRKEALAGSGASAGAEAPKA